VAPTEPCAWRRRILKVVDSAADLKCVPSDTNWPHAWLPTARRAASHRMSMASRRGHDPVRAISVETLEVPTLIRPGIRTRRTSSGRIGGRRVSESQGVRSNSFAKNSWNPRAGRTDSEDTDGRPVNGTAGAPESLPSVAASTRPVPVCRAEALDTSRAVFSGAATSRSRRGITVIAGGRLTRESNNRQIDECACPDDCGEAASARNRLGQRSARPAAGDAPVDEIVPNQFQ